MVALRFLPDVVLEGLVEVVGLVVALLVDVVVGVHELQAEVCCAHQGLFIGHFSCPDYLPRLICAKCLGWSHLHLWSAVLSLVKGCWTVQVRPDEGQVEDIIEHAKRWYRSPPLSARQLRVQHCDLRTCLLGGR